MLSLGSGMRLALEFALHDKLAQSRSDFGLASLIFVAPLESMLDGILYWFGPGVSAELSMRISVDV